VTKNYNSVPISGDEAHEECEECGSTNTIFEEYQSSREPDDSELGIICQECEHAEDPDEFQLRIESRVMNQYENT
jgi:hypothetical protein